MPLKHGRFPITVEVDRHGTAWFQPCMAGWYMGCCDCGLVHRVQFRIVRSGRRERVQLRARRAPRYTAQQRRLRKHPTRKAA